MSSIWPVQPQAAGGNGGGVDAVGPAGAVQISDGDGGLADAAVSIGAPGDGRVTFDFTGVSTNRTVTFADKDGTVVPWESTDGIDASHSRVACVVNGQMRMPSSTSRFDFTSINGVRRWFIDTQFADNARAFVPSLDNNTNIGWITNRVRDLYLSGDILSGAAASPTGKSISGMDGSGTNVAAGNIRIAGGRGTGNATPGTVGLQVSDPTDSGSTLQTLRDALVVDDTDDATETAATLYFNGAMRRVIVDENGFLKLDLT